MSEKAPDPNVLAVCVWHGAVCPPDERVFIDPRDLKAVAEAFFGE
jgi:hypothetical protein